MRGQRRCCLLAIFLNCFPPHFFFFFWDRVPHCTRNLLFWQDYQVTMSLESVSLSLPSLGHKGSVMPRFYVGFKIWTWILMLVQQALYPLSPWSPQELLSKGWSEVFAFLSWESQLQEARGKSGSAQLKEIWHLNNFGIRKTWTEIPIVMFITLESLKHKSIGHFQL